MLCFPDKYLGIVAESFDISGTNNLEMRKIMKIVCKIIVQNVKL